jgi:hypothetical protein
VAVLASAQTRKHATYLSKRRKTLKHNRDPQARPADTAPINDSLSSARERLSPPLTLTMAFSRARLRWRFARGKTSPRSRIPSHSQQGRPGRERPPAAADVACMHGANNISLTPRARLVLSTTEDPSLPAMAMIHAHIHTCPRARQLTSPPLNHKYHHPRPLPRMLRDCSHSPRRPPHPASRCSAYSRPPSCNPPSPCLCLQVCAPSRPRWHNTTLQSESSFEVKVPKVHCNFYPHAIHAHVSLFPGVSHSQSAFPCVCIYIRLSKTPPPSLRCRPRRATGCNKRNVVIFA